MALVSNKLCRQLVLFSVGIGGKNLDGNKLVECSHPHLDEITSYLSPGTLCSIHLALHNDPAANKALKMYLLYMGVYIQMKIYIQIGLFSNLRLN